jgi:phosphatidylglycerol:prolipoprotein diacylglycerol transferase
MFTTLAAYVHDIDPYAIMLWEGGPIRWYGLSYLVGFAIGWLLIRRVLTVGRSTFKPAQAMDIVVTMALSIVIGGRVGYAVFYDPSLLYTFTSQMPFWNLLAFNKGGMASHGGMIGLIISAFWIARRAPGGPHRVSHVLDLGAFAAPIGLGIGRIANFINGELYGRPSPEGFKWAVKFPQEMHEWGPNDPRIEALRPLIPNGQSMHGYEVIDRIITMIQNGSPMAKAAVEPLLTARYPSQLYQAFLEGVVLFAVLAILWWKPRRPILIGSAFCAVYGVLRIIAEQYRLPDAHIGYDYLGLTRGQWLSVALTLTGVVGAIIASMRKAEPMGGWR